MDLVQLTQHVEQHDGDAVDTADPGSVARGHRIEPAAAAGATGHGAVFVALFADVRADLVDQFRRAGAAPHARGVRLDHADHLVNRPLRHTAPGVNAAAGTVRRCDVRERPVIDVEQAALRSLEEHALTRLECLVQVRGRLNHMRAQLIGVDFVLVVDRVDIEWRQRRIES